MRAHPPHSSTFFWPPDMQHPLPGRVHHPFEIGHAYHAIPNSYPQLAYGHSPYIQYGHGPSKHLYRRLAGHHGPYGGRTPINGVPGGVRRVFLSEWSLPFGPIMVFMLIAGGLLWFKLYGSEVVGSQAHREVTYDIDL